MKIVFKLFMCIFVSVLMVAFGSGCKEATNTSKSNSPIEIKWMPQNDAPVDQDSPVIKEIEKKFNVKLDFIYLDRSKEKELLNMRIASNDIPDVMRLTGDVFQTYIDQGVLAELPEDVLKKYAPTVFDITKQNGGDQVWEFAKDKGKIYGIPYLEQNGVYAFVPIWRDDWLKNVGIDKIPATLDEAEDAFYKFANNDPDKNGKKDTYALSDKGMSAIYGAFGLQPNQWMLKDGKIVYSSTVPEMKEALTLLNKWYKDGLIDPEFITGENKGQNWANAVSFWNGKIGFSVPGMFYHINPPLYEGDLGSGNYQNFKKLQGDSATYKEGTPMTGPTGQSGTLSWGILGKFIVMGKNVANNPEKIGKILQIHEAYCKDFDFYVLATKGQKDIHYNIENGNYIANPQIFNDNLAGAKLGLSTNGVGYVANNFDFTKRISPARYEYADKVANLPHYANAVWAGLPSSVQYMPAIESKSQESIIKFIIGDKPLSEFDSYVDELKKAGLDQLTKEANDWYANYNK